MDEHFGLGLKGDDTAAGIPDSERARILEALSERPSLTVAELEAATGLKLMPKTLRNLTDSVAVLATHPCVERPDKRAYICLAPKGRWEQAVRSDELLLSLLKIRRADKTHLFTRAELQKALPRTYGTVFKAAFDARVKERSWPAGVGSLTKAGATLVFSLEDVVGEAAPAALAVANAEAAQQPLPVHAADNGSGGEDVLVNDIAAATPGATENGSDPAQAAATAAQDPNADCSVHCMEGFQSRFEDAFVRLDQQSQNFNRVSLRALRSELSGFEREEFERGLNELRSAGQFILETMEAPAEAPEPADMEAAIYELGRPYVYVARKES